MQCLLHFRAILTQSLIYLPLVLNETSHRANRFAISHNSQCAHPLPVLCAPCPLSGRWYRINMLRYTDQWEQCDSSVFRSVVLLPLSYACL